MATPIYVNINDIRNNPNFKKMVLDISAISISREVILNAFVVAAYEQEYMMAEKIKKYLIKLNYLYFAYLYDEIEEDVREYISNNRISLDEYLQCKQEIVICDDESENDEPSDKVYTFI